MFHVPEMYRVKKGPLKSDFTFGNYGAFDIPCSNSRLEHFQCIAAEGDGWEHVSVAVVNRKHELRTPSWAEMCEVKDTFWDEEDTVVQYHPRKSDYVNMHPAVLHLWRPIRVEMPRPRSELVGYKNDEDDKLNASLANSGMSRRAFDALREDIRRRYRPNG